MDSSKQNPNQVINSIEKTLGILHYLSSNCNNVANLNNLVLELDNMVKFREKCHNIQVPMKVLNLIDDGKNPNEFTRDVYSQQLNH